MHKYKNVNTLFFSVFELRKILISFLFYKFDSFEIQNKNTLKIDTETINFSCFLLVFKNNILCTVFNLFYNFTYANIKHFYI